MSPDDQHGPAPLDYAGPQSRPSPTRRAAPYLVFAVAAGIASVFASQIGTAHGDSHKTAVAATVFFGLASLVLPVVIQLGRTGGGRGDSGIDRPG